MQVCEPPKAQPTSKGLMRMETRTAATSDNSESDNLDYEQIQARRENPKSVNRNIIFFTAFKYYITNC